MSEESNLDNRNWFDRKKIKIFRRSFWITNIKEIIWLVLLLLLSLLNRTEICLIQFFVQNFFLLEKKQRRKIRILEN